MTPRNPLLPHLLFTQRWRGFFDGWSWLHNLAACHQNWHLVEFWKVSHWLERKSSQKILQTFPHQAYRRRYRQIVVEKKSVGTWDNTALVQNKLKRKDESLGNSLWCLPLTTILYPFKFHIFKEEWWISDDTSFAKIENRVYFSFT